MLVTDPKQRATMHEVMNHPWMVKGYNGPPENYMPYREPLKLPLDDEVIRHMTGFKFGPPEQIREQLTNLILSPKYQAAARRWEKEREQAQSVTKDAEKRRGFGFDFYKRRNSITSKETLTTTSSEGLALGEDILNAYDPLISIYYLVKEKLERERQAQAQQLSAPPAVQQVPASPHQSHAHVPPSPVVRPKEKHSMAEIAPPQPAHTEGSDGRTRHRARSHSEDQVREAVNNSLLTPEMIPQTKKTSGGGGNGPVSLLRRLSTRDRRREPGNPEGRSGTLIQKSVSMRAKSLGHARRESIQARRARREAEAREQQAQNPQSPMHQPPSVREETDAELVNAGVDAGETSGGSHDRLGSSSEDPDLVRPVYLKGIFSVSTTSTKPLPQIRADIKRVLRMLAVEFTEIRGGFSCTYRPSVIVPGDRDVGERRNSFQFSSQHDASRDRERVADGEIKFEIVIVKVPIVSLHGVQFKRVGGDTWQYKTMAEQIVKELRL